MARFGFICEGRNMLDFSKKAYGDRRKDKRQKDAYNQHIINPTDVTIVFYSFIFVTDSFLRRNDALYQVFHLILEFEISNYHRQVNIENYWTSYIRRINSKKAYGKNTVEPTQKNVAFRSGFIV